ncbi:MAG: hypothetical protein WBI44_11500 [Syntrophaceticus sp.]
MSKKQELLSAAIFLDFSFVFIIYWYSLPGEIDVYLKVEILV